MDPFIQSEAERFFTSYIEQYPEMSGRQQEVIRSIQMTGTYEQTASELAFGAKLAWSNFMSLTRGMR